MMTARPFRPAMTAVLVLCMAVCGALLLALPGQTVTTKYVNDLFIFLDGVQRVADGQVPNRDFHTALGPLNYYLPAMGHWLSGSFGGAMPVGMALVVLMLGPVGAYVVATRLRAIVALPLAGLLLLVAAAPMNPGESIQGLSFAMFYNRIGWAALGFLLVLYLPARAPLRRGALWDAAAAAFLILLMLYTKASYGAVALAFLGFCLVLAPAARPWAAGALGLVGLSALAAEAAWGGTAAHVADLVMASRVSGSVLENPAKLADNLTANFAAYVLYALLAIPALWRSRSLRDLLFHGFCAGAGFALILQNFQVWGVFTLAAGGAVAAESLARDAEETGVRGFAAGGAGLLFLASTLPAGVPLGLALGLHAGLAAARAGEPAPLPRFGEVRLVRLWTDGETPTFRRYFASLEDGARALARLDAPASHVLVLDFVSPFTAGLGLDPPRGDSTWHHWGRTVDETTFLAPERLFRDIRVVMEPKWPVEHATATGLKRIYGPWLAERYELERETADWRIHVLRKAPAEEETESADVDLDRMDLDRRETGSVPSGG
jgi:hypothetical protein